MYSIALNLPINVYKHKTFELVNIINDICDLIVTMNITYSLIKKIANPDITVLYFVSCSRDPVKYCKERYFIATSHMKIYRTEKKVFFSSSNLSLSNWDEITCEYPRTVELDLFIERIIQNLKLRNEFLKHFW